MKNIHLKLRKKWFTASVPSKWNWFCPYRCQPCSTFLATPTISANENLPQARENTETTTGLQASTDTGAVKHKRKLIFLHKNANASLEKKKKTLQQRHLKQQMLLQARQTAREDRSSEPTTSTPTSDQNHKTLKQKNLSQTTTSASMSKKLPEENKDSQGLGLGTMLKNLLKTGPMEPDPSRMPKR